MSTLTAPANPLLPRWTPGLAGGNGAAASAPQQFGVAVLMFYLFVMLGRWPEIIAIHLGSSYSIVLVSTIACVVFAVLTGVFRPLLSTKFTLFFLALHGWFLFTVPFSSWRYGSVKQLQNYAECAPMFFFIAVLIQNEKQLRSAFWAVCAAMLGALVYTMTFGFARDESYARVAIDLGRFGNPNDLALFLMMGIPFWLYLAVSSRFHVVLRLLAGAEILVSIFQILRTGSRGAVVTLGLLAITLFFVASLANKAKLALVVLGTIFIVVPFIPSSVRTRLGSLVGGQDDVSAASSSTSRLDLLLESLRVTAQHPVFGVGIGVYSEAVGGMAAKEGVFKPKQQVPHNTFTTISAETGIPGALFYIASLFSAGAGVVRARRIARSMPGMSDLALQAGCILLAFSIFVLNNLFFSITGDVLLYLTCGLCVACLAVTEAQNRSLSFARSQQQQPEPQQQQPAPARAVPLARPAKTPRFGQPGAEPLQGGSSQYGDVPWARPPRRS